MGTSASDDPDPRGDAPRLIHASKAKFMVEVKFDDKTQTSRPPPLHDSDSGEHMRSTYSCPNSKTKTYLSGKNQTLEYLAYTLTTQSPWLRGIFGTLITYTRLQMLFSDRGSCFYSAEINFSRNFAILPAVFIALQLLNGEEIGVETALARLVDPCDTPLPAEAFSTLDIEVVTGTVKTITRAVAPFKVEVQATTDSSEMISVYAFGHNLVERPASISGNEFISALEAESVVTPLSRRTSRRALKGTLKQLQLQQELEDVYNKGSKECPRQFLPRVIFGGAPCRFQARLDPEISSAVHMLQLSWQHKGAASEAAILRLANERGIRGVPTLVGSYDVAEMDEGSVRSRLRSAFDGLRSIRKVNMVLRAEAWKEICVPLHSITDIVNFLKALECHLQGMPLRLVFGV